MGFYITNNGFLVTNEHVSKDATQVCLLTSARIIPASIVKVVEANDLALPVAAIRGVKLGGTVATARKFDELVKSAEQAPVMVLVY
jgi:S1-C subfamily serine protease